MPQIPSEYKDIPQFNFIETVHTTIPFHRARTCHRFPSQCQNVPQFPITHTVEPELATVSLHRMRKFVSSPSQYQDILQFLFTEPIHATVPFIELGPTRDSTCRAKTCHSFLQRGRTCHSCPSKREDLPKFLFKVTGHETVSLLRG